MHHFNALDVERATPWNALIAALRAGFQQDVVVPARHPYPVGPGTALLMPAWREGGYFGVKTVTIFPGNGALGLPGVHGIYTLFSATTGQPLAVIDGSELTARRTAAASALAADFLAPPAAQRLLLVGAGRVAGLMPDALRSVRPGLQHVQVWNRSAAGAQQLAERLRSQGWDARSCTDLQTAVEQADIVSCATLSTAALVQGAWLRAGSHLDLIGSYTPQMREADGQCLQRSRVFVDTGEALAKAGDLLSAIAEGHFDAQHVQGTLQQLCRGERAGRLQADENTLFKSVGTALEDLAAAELVFGAAG